jgi:UDP-glucose:tetrahydrobiopterin glucosyltransferase
MLKLLLLSTPVASLGSGLGGGVDLTLQNLAQDMLKRGHELKIVAPEGSSLGNLPIIEIAGELQITAQTQGRQTPITMPKNSVLGNMWEYARQVQTDYDLIFNIAYDWLPFYLTPFFQRPIAHFISMGSLSEAMDSIAGKIAAEFPGTIGVYTKTQAETFPFAKECEILSSGIDLSLYEFCDRPENTLAWVARIAPEKALEDALAAAKIAGVRLKILGKVQDQEYWRLLCDNYADTDMEYAGFFPTDELQKQLRCCLGLLMTPRWVEAFGNVAIEALACGVPVISYRRGGPTEIVREGETGFLVEPDSIDGLVSAINRLDEIDRYKCRLQAETEYSIEALGDRFEQWFERILRS